MPFYIPPDVAIGIGFELYSNRGKIEEILNNLLKFIKTNFEITVFGTSSTGKTTLGLFIEGDRTFADISKADRSINLEFYALKESTNRNVLFVITPGEKRHEEENIKKLEEIIAKKKPFGFINVVSYGYQFPKQLKYEEMIPSGKTLEIYLEERRQEEIDLLKKLTTLISRAENLAWMLTLVTKQDLWWNKRNEVENHYKTGEYSKTIKEIQTEHERIFGQQKNPFIHECVSNSFVLGNVYSSDLKPITYTIGGYDQYIQAAHWKLLIDTLNDLKTRMEQRLA